MRLKSKLAEELRIQTMKLIDDKRLERDRIKSHQFAADSLSAARADKAARENVKEGLKQKKAVQLLRQKIDVQKYF